MLRGSREAQHMQSTLVHASLLYGKTGKRSLDSRGLAKGRMPRGLV